MCQSLLSSVNGTSGYFGMQEECIVVFEDNGETVGNQLGLLVSVWGLVLVGCHSICHNPLNAGRKTCV